MAYFALVRLNEYQLTAQQGRGHTVAMLYIIGPIIKAFCTEEALRRAL